MFIDRLELNNLILTFFADGGWISVFAGVAGVLSGAFLFSALGITKEDVVLPEAWKWDNRTLTTDSYEDLKSTRIGI